MKKFMMLLAFLAIGFLGMNMAKADFEIVLPADTEKAAAVDEEATEGEGSDEESATEGTEEEATDEEATTEEPADESGEDGSEGDDEEATDEEATTEEPATEETPTEPVKPEVVVTPAPKPTKLQQARDAAGKAKARKAEAAAAKKQNDEDEATLGTEVDTLLERANTYLDLVEKGVARETERATRIKTDRAAVKALTDEIEELIRTHVN